jgi:hypothetical protein
VRGGKYQSLVLECAVARAVWSYASEFLGFQIGCDYISVATKWLSREKFYVVNIITAAVLRELWFTRNNFVFNAQVWLDVKLVLKRVLSVSMEWKIICKESKMETMKSWLSFLVAQIREPLKFSSV